MDNETARICKETGRYGGISDSELCKGRQNNLVIAVGCTGGKHRSVTMARVLYNRLVEKVNMEFGWNTEISDKDLLKVAKNKKQ